MTPPSGIDFRRVQVGLDRDVCAPAACIAARARGRDAAAPAAPWPHRAASTGTGTSFGGAAGAPRRRHRGHRLSARPRRRRVFLLPRLPEEERGEGEDDEQDEASGCPSMDRVSPHAGTSRAAFFLESGTTERGRSPPDDTGGSGRRANGQPGAAPGAMVLDRLAGVIGARSDRSGSCCRASAAASTDSRGSSQSSSVFTGLTGVPSRCALRYSSSGRPFGRVTIPSGSGRGGESAEQPAASTAAASCSARLRTRLTRTMTSKATKCGHVARARFAQLAANAIAVDGAGLATLRPMTNPVRPPLARALRSVAGSGLPSRRPVRNTVSKAPCPVRRYARRAGLRAPVLPTLPG